MRAHLLSPSIILNSALAESGSLVLAADTAHCKASVTAGGNSRPRVQHIRTQTLCVGAVAVPLCLGAGCTAASQAAL